MRPVYDAQKARDYYLRTRHLKGRKAGVKVLPLGGGRGGPDTKPLPLGGGRGGPPVHKVKAAPVKPKKTAKQLRLEAHARTSALKVRLDQLHKVLAKLVKEAKGLGIETKSDTAKTKAASNQDAKDKPPSTVKQKREAAKRSAVYRKTHQTSVDAKSLQTDIEATLKKIKKIRAELKASVGKARSHAQSQTASKGR